MKLTKKSETSTKITFTYDKPAGPVEGYLYYSDGERVSRTFNPNDLEVTFGKVASGEYMVEAVGFTVIDRAEWPETPTPGAPEPPLPPFTQKTGNGLVQDASALGGGLIEHLHYTSIPGGYGPGYMVWPPKASTGRSTLRDTIAENVQMVGYPGTSGAAFWIGQTVDAYRLLGKNAVWMGMFTGSRCDRSSIHDVKLINMPKIGIYPEHCTSDSSFYDIEIECEENGVNMEWWYGPADNVVPEHAAWAAQKLGIAITKGRAGSWGNKFWNMKISSRTGAAIYIDAGNFANEFAIDGYLTLSGKYGIVLPRVLADPSRPNKYDLSNIDFTNIPSADRLVWHDNPMGRI